MLYATVNGERQRAQRGIAASCPSCNAPMLAKCGEIVIWHWAHLSSKDCDEWASGETDWHLAWKGRFQKSQVEVIVKRRDYRGEWSESFHRTDVLSARGHAIEFQHSSISTENIRKRNDFYRTVIWVFDAREPYDDDRLKFRDKKTHWTFKWNWPRKTIVAAWTPPWTIYLDTGADGLFEARAIYDDRSYLTGWGFWRTPEWFVAEHSGTAALQGSAR